MNNKEYIDSGYDGIVIQNAYNGFSCLVRRIGDNEFIYRTTSSTKGNVFEYIKYFTYTSYLSESKFLKIELINILFEGLL